MNYKHRKAYQEQLNERERLQNSYNRAIEEISDSLDGYNNLLLYFQDDNDRDRLIRNTINFNIESLEEEKSDLKEYASLIGLNVGDTKVKKLQRKVYAVNKKKYL